MEGDGLESLCRTHRVQRAGRRYVIEVNKPDGFIYDVSRIVVEYNGETGESAVRCAEFTDGIIENIQKFRNVGIAEYVRLIEDNLETFCMGRMPEISTPVDSRPVLRPSELPRDYKFPLSSNVTPNLRCDAMKSNVFMFTCSRISLTVACKKCGTSNSIDGERECRKCQSPMCLTFIPTFSPGFLGFLSLRACDFVCVDPTRYQFSCAQCQCNYETGEIGVNESYHLRCYDCHADIRIKIERMVYQQKRDYNLRVGTELPDRGTCKHYKKSMRWFRFSCCNALYPCDICHDADNTHPSEEAKRMVCGLCSREQSVKKECDCGMSLKKAHTQFWEGGKGNREKATMSKKDSRKYQR